MYENGDFANAKRHQQPYHQAVEYSASFDEGHIRQTDLTDILLRNAMFWSSAAISCGAIYGIYLLFA
ncbi:MAG: hypothetical protein RIB61_14270 [Roseicyclus sp.]|jgi:hypothetical protein